MFSRDAARRRGFTLIEMLIVVVVISILALIIIPRVLGATRKAREATLKGNLHQLRTAIEQFSADTGVYPAELIDLTRVRTDAPSSGIDETNVTVTIPNGSYKGPYLNAGGGIGTTGIPINPFKSPQDADYQDETTHWNYGTDGAGIVHPAIPDEGDTLDGVPYSEL